MRGFQDSPDGSNAKMDELVRHMQRFQVHVAMLAETWRPSHAELQVLNEERDFLFLNHGLSSSSPTRGRFGLGFFLSPSAGVAFNRAEACQQAFGDRVYAIRLHCIGRMTGVAWLCVSLRWRMLPPRIILLVIMRSFALIGRGCLRRRGKKRFWCRVWTPMHNWGSFRLLLLPPVEVPSDVGTALISAPLDVSARCWAPRVCLGLPALGVCCLSSAASIISAPPCPSFSTGLTPPGRILAGGVNTRLTTGLCAGRISSVSSMLESAGLLLCILIIGLCCLTFAWHEICG